MAEIVINVLPFCVLNEKVLVPFRHRVNMRDMCDDMQVVIYLATLADKHKSFFGNLRPFGSDAMQVFPFRIEFSLHGIWRDNHFCRLVDFHEIRQASSVVTMPMRDEHIINRP